MYKNNTASKPHRPEKTGFDVHDILNGTFCTNDDGTCFIIENRYPLTYLYGGYPLSEAMKIDMDLLKRVCPDLRQGTGVSDFMFLDTETTGLSGGTGTVAFLIGVGFFEKNAFVLRQYFMRDYDEEPSMLRALNELLSKYRGLVTFNGKAFDWNLLQTRYTFNRIRPGLKTPLHIDLLFPSRSIWKLKLESCRLSSLEENILGEYRVDDIPGALIPSVYFKYLENRDATDIKRVIKHNETDILSMVSLLVRICRMLENPFDETDREQELLGIGRIFEKSGEYDNMVECFETCMKSGCVPVKEKASRRLSDIYKKSRDYEKAVRHWEKMLDGGGCFDLFPLIELAKYYEHREKNVGKALETVEKAVIMSSKIGVGNSIHHRELIKRLERLKRKAGRESHG